MKWVGVAVCSVCVIVSLFVCAKCLRLFVLIQFGEMNDFFFLVLFFECFSIPHHWKVNFAKNASFHEALMDLLVQISRLKVDGPRQQYDIFLHSSFHDVSTRGFF